MKKPIIAVDIDDVLSRTAQTIVDYGNERWGHANTLDDFTEHLTEMWQVTPDEGRRRWEEYMVSGHIEKYDVIPEAKAALEQLSQRYTLIAVTARRDSLLDITREWLDTNYPGIITEIIGAGIYGTGNMNAHVLTKAEVLQNLGADYLIDDQPKHCIGAASVGVQAILYGGYPWNRNTEVPAGVVRCDTWQSVLEYFNDKP